MWQPLVHRDHWRTAQYIAEPPRQDAVIPHARTVNKCSYSTELTKFSSSHKEVRLILPSEPPRVSMRKRRHSRVGH